MPAVVEEPFIVIAPLIASFAKSTTSAFHSRSDARQLEEVHFCDVCNNIDFFDLDAETLEAIGVDTQYSASELTFVVEYESEINEEVKDACTLRAFLREHSSAELNSYRFGSLSAHTVEKVWEQFVGLGRLRSSSHQEDIIQREVAYVIICTNGMDGVSKPQFIPKQFEASRANLWLEHCKLEHGLICSEEVPTVEGMRLIDCEQLVIIDTKPLRTYVWLALSYVWGGPDVSAFPDTPRTITDAITVTKQLGYKYLWVDQYCINQDDEASKKDQISKMDQIYRGAVLTLVAVMGRSKHYGLPGVSSKRICREASYVVGQTKRVLYFSDSDPESDIRDDSPWYQRAWTYQEGYLSRRILAFTDEQIAFFCKCDSWIESWGGIEHLQRSSCGNHTSSRLRKSPCTLFQLSNRLPSTVSPETRTSDRVFEFLNLASQYTRRALSFDSDALNAFSGVMQHLRQNGQDPKIYDVCGLPILPGVEVENDQLCYIFIALAWTSSTVNLRRRSQFPSWSWTGWAGGVSWAWDASSLTDIKTLMRNVMFGLTHSEIMLPYREIKLDQLSSVTKVGFQAPVIPASSFTSGKTRRLGKDPLHFIQLWGTRVQAEFNQSLPGETPESILERLENRSLMCLLLGSFRRSFRRSFHDRMYVIIVEWQDDGLAARVDGFLHYAKSMEDHLSSYEWISIILV